MSLLLSICGSFEYMHKRLFINVLFFMFICICTRDFVLVNVLRESVFCRRCIGKGL